MKIITTTQLARSLGVPSWRVRRVFEDGMINVRMVGRRLIIDAKLIPQIKKALEQRGWLPTAELAAAA